jgi:hypothetical protein
MGFSPERIRNGMNVNRKDFWTCLNFKTGVHFGDAATSGRHGMD